MTLVLLPLTALFASLLMFAGSLANTSKQAQGSATAIMLIATIFPLAGQIDPSEETWVHGLSPIISQHRMMGRILEGELPAISSICIACLVSMLLTVLLIKMTTYRLTPQPNRRTKS